MAQPRRLDLLRGFEVFLALADTGSMTGASRLLRVTQSAVSQQLKLLEAELGTVLVDRQRRPLRLTPSGAALRQHAAQLLTQADRTRADVRQIASNRLPHLRIAMFSTLAKTLAPAIVEAVVNRQLKIQTVSILRGMAKYQGRELVDRDVDIAITSDPIYEVGGMERHELLQERFVLLAPRAIGSRKLSIRDLAQKLPLIRYSSRTEAGRLIERHLRRQRIDIPHTFSFDAPEEIFTMVAMGHGFAVTAPTHVAHALDPAAEVELRALPGPALSRGITLVARADEMGELPAQLVGLCRRVLARDYLPRVRRLMPTLTDHLTIVEEADPPR